MCEEKGGRRPVADACKKKKEREVEKRDSPQAQDYQAKWGEQLMNLPYAWTERKKIEEIGELAAR